MGHTQTTAIVAHGHSSHSGSALGWGSLEKTSLKGTGSGMASIPEHPQLVPACERTVKPAILFSGTTADNPLFWRHPTEV